ncbi:MAG: hypothetical protein IT379_27300 [Deltaproteobacteria bacterium]|nr:hypothetical protein [Deltaproteobacteria bacterium]
MSDLRSGNCPLCDHHEVVEARPGEFGDGSREVGAAVAYEPRWVLGGRNPEYPYGHLSVCFCRACGYTQWFTAEPDKVPIGDEYETRLIEGKRKGPAFR